MVDQQNYNCANESDHNAVEVDTGRRRVPEKVEYEAADERADNPKDDIHHHTRPGLFDDHTGQEAGNEAHNEPCENRHQTEILRALVAVEESDGLNLSSMGRLENTQNYTICRAPSLEDRL
jgi:hypothetical protein